MAQGGWGIAGSRSSTVVDTNPFSAPNAAYFWRAGNSFLASLPADRSRLRLQLRVRPQTGFTSEYLQLGVGGALPGCQRLVLRVEERATITCGGTNLAPTLPALPADRWSRVEIVVSVDRQAGTGSVYLGIGDAPGTFERTIPIPAAADAGTFTTADLNVVVGSTDPDEFEGIACDDVRLDVE